MVEASSSPNISENIFIGEEGGKQTGLRYIEGSGICYKNTFNNFKNPAQPPIVAMDKASQFGPRLLDNMFTNCVAPNATLFQDHFVISSGAEGAKISSSIGDNVKRDDKRSCSTCHTLKPCFLCNGCLRMYYCGEECQKIDWEKGHQKYCTNYRLVKNHC